MPIVNRAHDPECSTPLVHGLVNYLAATNTSEEDHSLVLEILPTLSACSLIDGKIIGGLLDYVTSTRRPVPLAKKAIFLVSSMLKSSKTSRELDNLLATAVNRRLIQAALDFLIRSRIDTSMRVVEYRMLFVLLERQRSCSAKSPKLLQDRHPVSGNRWTKQRRSFPRAQKLCKFFRYSR